MVFQLVCQCVVQWAELHLRSSSFLADETRRRIAYDSMSSATPRICNKTLNSIQISLICKRRKHSRRHMRSAGSTSDSLQGGSTSDSLQGRSLGPIFLYLPQDVVVSCNFIVISNSMYMSYLWLGLFRFLFGGEGSDFCQL